MTPIYLVAVIKFTYTHKANNLNKKFYQYHLCSLYDLAN